MVQSIQKFISLSCLFVTAGICIVSLFSKNSNTRDDINGASRPAIATSIAPLKFRKQLVAYESFESVGVFDVNNDRQLDIVSGAFWYEAPGFVRRHYIGEPSRFGEYYNDFSTVPVDVDGD